MAVDRLFAIIMDGIRNISTLEDQDRVDSQPEPNSGVFVTVGKLIARARTLVFDKNASPPQEVKAINPLLEEGLLPDERSDIKTLDFERYLLQKMQERGASEYGDQLQKVAALEAKVEIGRRQRARYRAIVHELARREGIDINSDGNIVE